MWQLAGGVFLGWALGSNDASNVFGTAVASRMVRFSVAAVLAAIFIILGAVLEGEAGLATYATLSPLTPNWAFVVSTAAALTVSLMTLLGLPVSTSQAVVGALVLAGLTRGVLELDALTKVIVCWVTTPIGAAIATLVLYRLLGELHNRLWPTLFARDRALRWLLLLAGSYGAYALGANNVANVTGPFVGGELLGPAQATLIGGAAMAFGVLTFGRNVMLTVGRNLVRLDAYSAFVAIVSEALTVHIYAMIGVPVSTSQAIVGAVLGIGVVKGMRTINRRTLGRVLFGWVGTPAIAAAVAWGLALALHLD